MKIRSILLKISLLFLAIPALQAETSMLDKAHGRQLTAQEQPMFGPKSGSLRYDPRMIRAAQIARERAHPKMTWYCWRYVKNAMLAAGLVSSRPTSAWAREAGDELSTKYGFKKLDTRNPYAAPVGAVIVYGGNDAGHVELRTETGSVSDFTSRSAYPRPVLGIYVKPA